MKTTALKKLARDMRLNSDAVRVVIFVDSRGKGKHEIPNDEFRTLLHMAGPKKVSLALRLAESSGWLERTKGGWGTPDSFEFVDLTDPSKMEGTEDPTDPAALVVTGDSLTLPKWKAQGTDPSKMEGSTRAREIRKRERVVGVDIGGEENSAQYEIDPKVAEALTKEEWNGFRSSLKDYFKSRVETHRQWGYLMTIKTWFQGSTAAPKGFFTLPPTKQALLVATAVNELLSENPIDEKLAYRSSRGMVGSTSVLRSKIEYHLRRGGTWDKPTEQIEIGDPDSVFPEDRS